MGRLDGKVAIVTGASRGIGAEIAKLFAAEGAKVVCSARTLREGDSAKREAEPERLEGSLEKTMGEVHAVGGEVTLVAGDLSAPEECERLVRVARDTYGPVDVLVNNAVVSYPYFTPIKDYPLEHWMRAWAVNLHAPFLLCKLALEDMIPRGSGSIVNISSGAAIGPGRGPYPNAPANPGATCYGASKAALERFTQGLALEVYQYGVSVTCVSPSQVVPTPSTIYDGLVSGMDDPRGEPAELMAKATLLLATEPLNKVTGRVTYSQQILKEFRWITKAKGRGVDPDRPGSGYSQI